MSSIKKSLKQFKVLITSGPTREYIDPIRFISNLSSGQMGYFLAKTILKDRAKVTVISGPVQIKPPKKARTIFIETANEMLREVQKNIKSADIFISCAAVSDYRPEKFLKKKIKRSKKTLLLKLIQNPDILGSISLSKKYSRKLFVGFALETNNLLKNAIKKLRSKNLDIIVANSEKTIGQEKSSGYIITKNGEIEKFNSISKEKLSKILWRKIKIIYGQKFNKKN